MYLQVTDLEKSYGQDAGYTQVLKGITMGVERGQMCVNREQAEVGSPLCFTVLGGLTRWILGQLKWMEKKFPA